MQADVTPISGPLTAAYIAASMVVGAGFAIQVAMIAAVARQRGSFEATWISLLATVAGFTVLMAARAVGGATVSLPSPFQRAPVFAVIAVVAAAGLAAAVRGLPGHFALTGLLAIPLLVGAGFVGPRLGVGIYISSVIAGQLACSVVLDHVGAFGVPVRRVDAARVVGVVLLVAGVALVRGVRG